METLSFEDFIWLKQSWNLPQVDNNTKKMLLQCVNVPTVELENYIEEIMKKIRSFSVSLPIETVRLEVLKQQIPTNKLKNNIISTYPIIHERVLILLGKFLLHKSKHGTSKEKACYKNMTIPQLINRLLTKRAVCFLGKQEWYQLLSGEKGTDSWGSIGTAEEKPPLLLQNCLSYDELRLSALVFVSGFTECINDGSRYNNGIVGNDAENEAVIVGLIAPRFFDRSEVNCENIIIIQDDDYSYFEQEETGGFFSTFFQSEEMKRKAAKTALTRIWEEFYENPTIYYYELSSNHIAVMPTSRRYANDTKCRFRYVPESDDKKVFDNQVYYRRISILADALLLEAEYRAKEIGKNAFINVVGCGLGNFLLSNNQSDIYILTFLERINAFLNEGLLNHVTDVNFAYIETTSSVKTLFTDTTNGSDEVLEIKHIFFRSETHPKGGINVQMQNREPSSKLTGEHAGKLLVLTYPADCNSLPGNEFWQGSLNTSGGAAAACSTQISELHNPHVNPAVSGYNVRVVGRHGLKTLSEYCDALTTTR